MLRAVDQEAYGRVVTHDSRDVYRVALDFAGWARLAGKGLPAGKAGLRDQLTRAAESVVLNIAEGSGQRSLPVARRHYRVALGSAAECSAAVDLMEIYGVTDPEQGRALIRRVGAMLWKMAG